MTPETLEVIAGDWANEGAQARLVFSASDVPLDGLRRVPGFTPFVA